MADVDARDERIISEYVAGAEVADLAARYGVPEAYVSQILEDRAARGPVRGHDWGLRPLGNRILYSIVAAVLFSYLTDSPYGLAAGVVAFLVLSFAADRT